MVQRLRRGFNRRRMLQRAMTPPPSAASAHPANSGGADLLVQIAAGLAEGRDLRRLLDRLLEPMVALAGAQAGAVRLLSDSGDQLQLVSGVGLPAAVHAAKHGRPALRRLRRRRRRPAAWSGRPTCARAPRAAATRYFGQRLPAPAGRAAAAPRPRAGRLQPVLRRRRRARRRR